MIDRLFRLAGFALLAVIVFGWLASRSDSTGDSNTHTYSGQECSAKRVAALQPSPAAVSALVRSFALGDRYGVVEAATNGPVIEMGTRLLVLGGDYDHDGYPRLVRVLDGPHEGAKGWLPRDWLAPADWATSRPR